MRPLSLLIKPASDLCNMNCSYCFYRDVASQRQTASRGIMPLDVLEKLVSRALTEADGFCAFTFQGGEPTLAGLDFFRQLIAFEKQYNCKNLPIRHAIQTNGLLLDADWASFFAENHFLVGVSIDGTRELHDQYRCTADGNETYARIIRNTEILNRRQAEYNVLCVVHNGVARRPQKTYAALRQYRYLQFIPCLDPLDGKTEPWSLDPKRYGSFLQGIFDAYYADFFSPHPVSIRMFDNFIGILAGRPPESCGMTGVCSCGFVTETDGAVYPCDFYALDEYRLGSIQENSFSEMLAASKPFVQASYSIHEDCKNCKWRALCRGGCRRERETSPGKLGKNRFCSAYRSFFEYAYPRLLHCASAVRAQKAR